MRRIRLFEFPYLYPFAALDERFLNKYLNKILFSLTLHSRCQKFSETDL